MRKEKRRAAAEIKKRDKILKKIKEKIPELQVLITGLFIGAILSQFKY